MKLLLILVLVAVPPALGQTCSEGCSTTSKNCQPEQIHIAFGEKINDITITWSTMNDTSETVVQFGEETANTTATGKGKLFDNGDEHRQWIHNVFLKDLKYNTSYVYKVGSKYGWSDQFSFMTPLAGEQYPVSAIVYGDLGYDGDKSTENIKEDITNKRYDLIIHNGDFAYQLNSDDGRNGDNFMNLIQKIAAYVPYMTSPGNHESASAPTHIVTGSAGMFAHTDHFISNPQPWSALRNSDYGYCRLVVYNHTHLYLEAVSTDHVEKTLLPKKAKAKKIDEMWLVREKHQPYDI